MTTAATGVDTRDMLVVHDAVRREWGLAPGLVRAVEAGDTRRAEVVAAHLDLQAAMLHHHHEGEDRVLWPVLLPRVPEALAPALLALEADHAGIAETQARVTAALTRWRAGAGTEDREALARALDELLVQITEHLAAEETNALPLCASLLSPAEWHRLGQEGMAGLPKRQLPLALGSLMHGADPQVITMMLSHLPLPARILLPRLARRAYARYALTVYGTATP